MGNTRAVERHLEGGARPDEVHDDGFTALMTAAEAGPTETVAVLATHPFHVLGFPHFYAAYPGPK